MKARYLFPSDYMADPAAHVFNGKLYVYPSHDRECDNVFDDDGGHFQMRDYHVLSFDNVETDPATTINISIPPRERTATATPSPS